MNLADRVRENRARRERRLRRHEQRRFELPPLDELTRVDAALQTVLSTALPLACKDTKGGFGKCQVWAIVGATVLDCLGIGGLHWTWDAGCLAIFPDTPKPEAMAHYYGPKEDGTEGSYHAWVVGYREQAKCKRLPPRAWVVVDFTARHYKRYCDGEWQHPFDPPDFLCCVRAEMPDWVAVLPIEAERNKLQAELWENMDFYGSLAAAVLLQYQHPAAEFVAMPSDRCQAVLAGAA